MVHCGSLLCKAQAQQQQQPHHHHVFWGPNCCEVWEGIVSSWLV
jgi:hypothetical protein